MRRRRGGLCISEGSEKSTERPEFGSLVPPEGSSPMSQKRTIITYVIFTHNYKAVRCSQTSLLKCPWLMHFTGREDVRLFIVEKKGIKLFS